MHKEFLQTSLKLLGFSMMGFILNSPTQGMDIGDDPNWCSKAKHHNGMKMKASIAWKQAEDKCNQDIKRGLYSAPWHQTPEGRLGIIVCAYCETLELNPLQPGPITNRAICKKWYEGYFKPTMTTVCQNSCDSESHSYRWKFSPI